MSCQSAFDSAKNGLGQSAQKETNDASARKHVLENELNISCRRVSVLFKRFRTPPQRPADAAAFRSPVRQPAAIKQAHVRDSVTFEGFYGHPDAI